MKRSELIENIHYYLEEGRWVFTEAYHLNRGHCCNNKCRHCPYKTNNMTLEKIAKVAHEINRAYCQAIGDNSQPTWENAPEWQKSSAINGVDFHIKNPNAGPDASHNSWLKQKKEEGWKYGPVKNPDTKEPPCFVPYQELPTEQQAKDYLFRQVIHSLNPVRTGGNLSFGEQLVGLTFNPSGDPKVQRAKELCAELADLLNSHDESSQPTTDFAQRLFSHAVGEILNAQMNVVKVLTFKY